jgi:hypothetical protein
VRDEIKIQMFESISHENIRNVEVSVREAVIKWVDQVKGEWRK